MALNQITNPGTLTVKLASLIAGIATLVMAFTVPVAEFRILPSLIDYKDAAGTFLNIRTNPTIFSTAILIQFTTVICDLVLAWALYYVLRPYSRKLALLAAWARMVYTAFNVAALMNLIHVMSIIRLSDGLKSTPPSQLHDQVLISLRTFSYEWRLGLLYFGFYLAFLGVVIYKSGYIPKWVGLAVLLAGLGYIIDDLKVFLFPELNTGYLWFTYLGELVFMGWLIWTGTRRRDSNYPTRKMASHSVV